jgi:hypothetical protein
MPISNIQEWVLHDKNLYRKEFKTAEISWLKFIIYRTGFLLCLTLHGNSAMTRLVEIKLVFASSC